MARHEIRSYAVRCAGCGARSQLALGGDLGPDDLETLGWRCPRCPRCPRPDAPPPLTEDEGRGLERGGE